MLVMVVESESCHFLFTDETQGNKGIAPGAQSEVQTQVSEDGTSCRLSAFVTLKASLWRWSLGRFFLEALSSLAPSI